MCEQLGGHWSTRIHSDSKKGLHLKWLEIMGENGYLLVQEHSKIFTTVFLQGKAI